MNKEYKIASYTGQCPFLMARRDIDIKFERQNDLAIPVENQCDYDEDCNYFDGCPVLESRKREVHHW